MAEAVNRTKTLSWKIAMIILLVVDATLVSSAFIAGGEDLALNLRYWSFVALMQWAGCLLVVSGAALFCYVQIKTPHEESQPAIVPGERKLFWYEYLLAGIVLIAALWAVTARSMY